MTWKFNFQVVQVKKRKTREKRAGFSRGCGLLSAFETAKCPFPNLLVFTEFEQFFFEIEK